MRVLIDTDIGDDIDDALALALAMRHPAIDLIGVTTVFRDTQARARMARHLLDLYGHRHVPVHAGSGKPLMEPVPRLPLEPQLDLTPAEVMNPAHSHAVEAILGTYSEPGSDVILVTIGPLTNLALALAIDPSLAERIPRVVTMGGQVGRAAPEWNILCDAEAAAIVLRAGLPLTLVPLDVTTRTGMQARHIAELEAAEDEPTHWLMTLTRSWKAKPNHLPILHDPLALAVAFDPGRVKTQDLSLEVLTASGPGRGITCVAEGVNPPVHVALEVDGEGFVDWYVEQVLSK